MQQKMQKLKPIFYIFLLLIMFSIIWFLLFQPKSYSELNTKLMKVFWKQNEDNTEITQKNFTIAPQIQIPSTINPLNISQVPPGDYRQLVNLHNFEFLHLVQCEKNGQYPSLLIAVHTAPKNVELRKAIRETWGMERPTTKLIFMMGVPQKQEELNIAQNEQEQYKDIVQGNFMDTYKNLTYKHVMLLKYVTYHCPKINYLLKTDDDVFVNMPAVLTYIQNYNDAKPRELLYCSPMVYSPALRDKNSKWYVSFDEFPEKFFPPYCSGYVELFTQDTVIRLYEGAQISKFLWVDDAFVTGIAREATNIKITPMPSLFFLNHNQMETIIKINNSYPYMSYTFLVGPVNINFSNIRALWNIITNQKNR